MPGKYLSNRSLLRLLVGVGLLVVIVVLAAAHANGLRLRMDLLMTYARGLIDPVQPLPTAARSVAEKPPPQVYTLTPTPTQTVFLVSTTRPASLASPTATFTPTVTPTPPPPRARLEAPPYELQDINNCGPATLSMYLHYYGWQGDQFAISDLIKPHRDDRNVNVEELQTYMATNVGFLSFEYRVGGNLTLLRRLLAGGFPVMIEEGFKMADNYWPNDDRWAGHYLLLTGYDDDSQSFIAQDAYVSPNRIVSYDELDRNWKAFNRVYMIVYPPEQRDQIQQILGADWDRDQNRQRALDMARQETVKNPTDSYAWFNLGTNLVYFEKYSEGAQAYDQARNLGLPQRMLRYQFGPFFAYFNTGRNDDLLALTEYALKRTPNSEEAMLWRGWALYRKGDVEGAVKMFQDAQNAHPGYTDAQYALSFVQGN